MSQNISKASLHGDQQSIGYLERLILEGNVANIVIGIIIIISNGFTISVIFKCKWLHTKSNALIFSLSLADMYVGEMCLYQYALHGLVPPKLLAGLVIGSLFCSVLHLLPIAVERFISIIYPLRYEILITTRTIKAMIVSVWSISLAMTILFISVYISGVDGYTDSIGIFGYILYLGQFCVLDIIYVRILTVAYKQARQIRDLQLQRQSNYRSEVRATVSLFFVVLAYGIAWTPSCVFAILNYYGIKDYTESGGKGDMRLNLAFFLIGYCNSVINCFIYAWKNKDFRRGYASLMQFMKKTAF